jgi:microcystin-dependent protein
MSDQFLAEIRIFPFNFPPTGWAFCEGQIMPISQNTALFALLGTTYGGDGKSTFALPNMQDNAPMQPGQGQGLSLRDLGEMSGVESITLLQSEIPIHTHILSASNAEPTTDTPSPAELTARGFWDSGSESGQLAFYTPTNSNPAPVRVNMAPQALSLAGGGLPHNNMQPYLTLNFCIALQGIFPQRP